MVISDYKSYIALNKMYISIMLIKYTKSGNINTKWAASDRKTTDF